MVTWMCKEWKDMDRLHAEGNSLTQQHVQHGLCGPKDLFLYWTVQCSIDGIQTWIRIIKNTKLASDSPMGSY